MKKHGTYEISDEAWVSIQKTRPVKMPFKMIECYPMLKKLPRLRRRI